MSCLSEDLWQVVMRCLSVQERLCVCALVSKSLHRAAVAATDHLEINFTRFSSEQMECFWGWLDHHGQHVTTLVAFGKDSIMLSRLPCQNLRQLQLSDCRVQLGPSSSQPGVLQACTALTQLVLSDCTLAGGPTSLTVLSAVPALQHLELQDLWHDDSEGPQGDDFELPAAVLSCLAQLTSFTVGRSLLHVGVCLQHLSCLRKLQLLSVSDTQAISPSTAPGLDKLTALQEVELRNVTLDPTALQGCTTLQRLVMTATNPVNGTHDMQPLLDLIAQQQQLRHLSLSTAKCNWPPASSAYTALSASSKLQQLHVFDCGLPAGIWQQGVFRPGQQLPELQSFVFRQRPAAGAPIEFRGQDVAALVSCCPALQVVEVCVQPGVQLTGLSQLTALEQLRIIWADSLSISSLSALSNLRHLHSLLVAGHNDQVNPAEFLQLTSLRCLKSLVALYLGSPPMKIISTGPPGEPNLWQQLLHRVQQQGMQQQQQPQPQQA